MAFLSSLFGNNSDHSAEYKRFKKAMERNAGDDALKAQFIKFCLLNRFTNPETAKEHLTEALGLFEVIGNKEPFDFQCHYLAGKYYQEEGDYRKAYGIYLGALKRFNLFANKSPGFKKDNSEMAYSVALNLMTLQHDPVDPEVEKCFQLIRKSFPLHLKRVELESEMAKPAPDKERIKKLRVEIQKLRAEEEQESQVETEAQFVEQAAAEKIFPTSQAPEKELNSPEPPPSAELKGLFSKMFNELSPAAVGLTEAEASKAPPAPGQEQMDFFKISPVSEGPANKGPFLVFNDNKWEGPFTVTELSAKGFLKPVTWVCPKGSQQVVQASEVPDLQGLLKK